MSRVSSTSLQGRNDGGDGVSNHQPHDCLLNRLLRYRSKKSPKLRVTGRCAGNSPVPVNSLHKRPVKRKWFPFNDVIMYLKTSWTCNSIYFRCVLLLSMSSVHVTSYHVWVWSELNIAFDRWIAREEGSLFSLPSMLDNWDRNFILMKFLSLTALKVVIFMPCSVI